MIPVDFTFHPSWWHKNAGICFNERFFNDPDYRIEADIQMRKILYDRFGDLGFGEKSPEPRPLIDSDLLAGEYLQSQILGCDMSFSDENLPYVASRNLSEENIANLSIPELEDSKAWKAILKQIEYLEEKYGYIESYIDLHGVQNLALDIRGPELFEDYYDNKDIANKALEVSRIVIEEVASYLRHKTSFIGIGVTSVVKHINRELYITSNCTVEMISNKLYEEFLLQHDSILSRKFQPFGIHHCGKTLEHVTEGYSKVPGVSFIEAGAFSNLELTRFYFPDVFINARYSPVKLKEASKEEIEMDIVEMAGKAKPLSLLSFSCVGIDSGIEDEKIRTFVKAVRKLKM